MPKTESHRTLTRTKRGRKVTGTLLSTKNPVLQQLDFCEIICCDKQCATLEVVHADTWWSQIRSYCKACNAALPPAYDQAANMHSIERLTCLKGRAGHPAALVHHRPCKADRCPGPAALRIFCESCGVPVDLSCTYLGDYTAATSSARRAVRVAGPADRPAVQVLPALQYLVSSCQVSI